jgi:uncharacterized membrane protein YcaP (DUF421 family)
MTNPFDEPLMPKWAVIGIGIVIGIVGVYQGINPLHMFGVILALILTVFVLTYISASSTGKLDRMVEEKNKKRRGIKNAE